MHPKSLVCFSEGIPYSLMHIISNKEPSVLMFHNIRQYSNIRLLMKVRLQLNGQTNRNCIRFTT